MPTYDGVIGADGPLVKLLLGPSAPDVQAWRTTKIPIPPSVTIHALLDTGADVTCIDRSVLAPLLIPGLLPLRFVFVNTPAAGGMNIQCEYGMSVTILHPSGNAGDNLSLPDVPVVEQDLAGLGYEALVGRNVLSMLDDFTYRGKAGVFSLSY